VGLGTEPMPRLTTKHKTHKETSKGHQLQMRKNNGAFFFYESIHKIQQVMKKENINCTFPER